MMIRLPLELQMHVCNVAAKLDRPFIPSMKFNKACRDILEDFTDLW